jgi:hypothetical protein
VQVIQMRDYRRRVRAAGIHAEQVHDQIVQALKNARRVRLDFANVESVGASFLDRSLGALVVWRGATVLRSIVFVHCSAEVEASIVNTFRQAGPLDELLNFSERIAS